MTTSDDDQDLDLDLAINSAAAAAAESPKRAAGAMRDDSAGLPQIRTVVVGHVDHGKSTTVGRLFWDTDSLDQEEKDDLREQARELGREGYEYAFVLDRLRDERQGGMTIGLAHKKLRTSVSSITIADAPGHREFVENMLRGAATSDAAVLVVAVDEGIREQCRQHLLLCETFGLRQLLVVINKMDLVDYSQAPFESVRAELLELLASHGYPADTLILPCSSLEGENVTTRSDRMAWSESGCLLEALEQLHHRAAPVSLPLRLPVQDSYSIDGSQVVVGRLETGALKVGMAVVSASGVVATVSKLQIGPDTVSAVVAGDNVYVWFDAPVTVARGDVIGASSAAQPPMQHTHVRCTLALLEGAPELGRDYTFRVHTGEVTARVEAIDGWIDPETGVRQDGAPENPTKGEVCDVRLKLSTPIHLEPQSVLPQLARVSLLQNRLVVAEGLCTNAGPTL